MTESGVDEKAAFALLAVRSDVAVERPVRRVRVWLAETPLLLDVLRVAVRARDDGAQSAGVRALVSALLATTGRGDARRALDELRELALVAAHLGWLPTSLALLVDSLEPGDGVALRRLLDAIAAAISDPLCAQAATRSVLGAALLANADHAEPFALHELASGDAAVDSAL